MSPDILNETLRMVRADETTRKGQKNDEPHARQNFCADPAGHLLKMMSGFSGIHDIMNETLRMVRSS